MPKLTAAELAALGGREYIGEIKSRLRDDHAWVTLLDPSLVERTRWGLTRIVTSIDEQKSRVLSESGAMPDAWLKSVDALRSYASARLSRLLPPSNTKEIRAWKTFSARLATALERVDPVALDLLETPYGGLTAAEWLAARDTKEKK